MSKKRTKKQKTRATYHYAYPAGKSFISSRIQRGDDSTAAFMEKSDGASLYLYDPQYTRRDLAKTLAITFLMIIIEIGLFFWF